MPKRRQKLAPASVEAIAQRLIVFRRAIGLTTIQICHRLGASPTGSTWTNYEMAIRRISLDHALRLRDEFGLTLEWIYCGEEFARIEPDMKAKLLEHGGNPLPVFVTSKRDGLRL